MAFKMLLLAFSVLVFAKVTLGRTKCESPPFAICKPPEQIDYIPREISAFNDYCVAIKSHFRCIIQWQNECGRDRITSEIFEATYDTLSEICEEGTLLNTVATENLKCFNETLGETKCHKEAYEFAESFIREIRRNKGSESTLSISCLKGTLVCDCFLRAISDNCGEFVREAALEVIRRSKTLKNICSVRGAQSVLDELDNLVMSEDKKRSMTQLLEKLMEDNND